MKKISLVLLTLVAAAFGTNASAQGKYGADSAECIKYLSYYQEYYKQKNYTEALPNWRKAFSLCPPTASQNMLLNGMTLMSKAWGCAALRLGMAFASKEIIDIFNKVKYPYNVNLLTQQQALEVLKNPLKVDEWVKNILQERSKVMAAFLDLPITVKVYPTDANFFLVKVTDAQAIYDYLVAQGIIVRNRNKVQLCGNCLRITIGNKTENAELLGALRQY